MSKAKKAAETLAGYFETVYRKAGLGWDYDSNTELENVVQDIIGAATPDTIELEQTIIQQAHGALATAKKERDEANLIALEAVKEMNKACRERDNLRELLRKCYPHIGPDGLRCKVLAALPDVGQPE